MLKHCVAANETLVEIFLYVDMGSARSRFVNIANVKPSLVIILKFTAEVTEQIHVKSLVFWREVEETLRENGSQCDFKMAHDTGLIS